MDNFKRNLQEQLKDRFDMDVSYQKITKLNDVILEGIMVKNFDGSGNARPTVYVSELFAEFQKGKPLEKIAEEFYFFVSNENLEIDTEKIFSADYVKKNVFFQLISKKWNKDLLDSVLYREVGKDMALILRIHVNMGKEVGSILIYKNWFETLGNREWLDENVLFDFAIQNTPRIFPYMIENIQDIVDFPEDIGFKLNMYALTNTKYFFGAGVILYDGVLRSIADMLNVEKLIIIPSSIHEVLIFPEIDRSKEELRSIIKEVNAFGLSRMERLDDKPYIYDRTEDKIIFD